MISRGDKKLAGYLYDRGVKLGTAISSWQLRQLEWFLTRNFVSLTPEVEMKIDRVRPAPDVWDFSGPKKIIDFAVNHSMYIHGHCLRWNLFVPDWIRNLDKNSQRAVIKEFIEQSIIYYEEISFGRMDCIDVVNEGYHINGYPYGDIWDQCGATVPVCFEWARKITTSIKLCYNDFNWSKPWQDIVWRELVEPGLVDCIGFQCHLSSGDVIPDDVITFIEKLGERGIKTRITELDVCGSNPVSTYADIADKVRKFPHLIECVTTWGVSDKMNWRYKLGSCEHPLLFDNSMLPNQSYIKFLEVIRSP